jgi:hypothetical protein
MKEYSNQSQGFPPPYIMDSKMITIPLVFFVLPNKNHTSYEVVLKYAMTEARILALNVV